MGLWTKQKAEVSSACFCLGPRGGTVASSLLPAPGTGDSTANLNKDMWLLPHKELH